MIRLSLGLLVAAASLLNAQADVLTQRYDNARSGANLHEAILNQQNVRNRFGKLWTLYADAKIMAQPLYVSNLKPPAGSIYGSTAKVTCASGCNVVIFATMKGTVYAYMADQQPGTKNDTLVWATYLSDKNACKCGATGPQNSTADFDMWAVDDPWWGILGTPVIDRAANSLYVVDWTNDQQYRLYNLNLATGSIQGGPVTIQGSAGNQTFFQNTRGFVQRRKQRAGLLLSNGLIYVAFGGDNPNTLAGWLFVYDARTLALKTVWSPTPKGRNSGIWQSGQGLSADHDGNIYLQTGDGDFDPANQSYGDSLLKLRMTGNGLTVTDYFAPCNQMMLQKCDLDQGSAGPVLFDGFLVSAGKSGELYLMRADKLGGYQPGPYPPPALMCEPGMLPGCTDSPKLLQRWQASMGHIHGAPVFWHGPANRSWLYIMGEADPVKAFPFDGHTFNVAAAKRSKWVQPRPSAPFCTQIAHWMPGGFLTVSSNGSEPGTGIVWVLTPANGDANTCRGVKGMLMALDAEDISKELWRSQAQDIGLADTKDSFGLLSRFVPPVVANGKVFIATAGDKEPLERWSGPRPARGPANYYLAVYGLRQ